MQKKTNIWLDIPGLEDPYGSFPCFWEGGVQHLVPQERMKLYLSLLAQATLTWLFEDTEMHTQVVPAGESRLELTPLLPLRAGTVTLSLTYSDTDVQNKHYTRSFVFIESSCYSNAKIEGEAREKKRKEKDERRAYYRKSCPAPAAGQTYDDLIIAAQERVEILKGETTDELSAAIELVKGLSADTQSDDDVLANIAQIEERIAKVRGALQRTKGQLLTVSFYREEKETHN